MNMQQKQKKVHWLSQGTVEDEGSIKRVSQHPTDMHVPLLLYNSGNSTKVVLIVLLVVV